MLKKMEGFYGRNRKNIFIGVMSIGLGVGVGVLTNKFIKNDKSISKLDFHNLYIDDIADEAVDVIENLTE